MKKINFPFIFIIQQILWIILLILSIIQYKSRICFADNALYLFEITRKGDFFIQHSRWIAVFTQLIPYIQVKLHTPLKFIMIGYSINIVLLPLLSSFQFIF